MKTYEVWIHYKEHGLVHRVIVDATCEPEALQLALDKLELCEENIAANYIYDLTEAE